MQKSSQKNKIEHDSKTYCVNIGLDALFPRQDVLSMLANQKSTTEDMLTCVFMWQQWVYISLSGCEVDSSTLLSCDR